MVADNNANSRVMRQIDLLLSHVWMVRTFLKHSEEAAEDDELAEVHRGLYDFMLALGGPLRGNDGAAYMKICRKKWAKFNKTVDLFLEIQPEVSEHTNFKMAAASLALARREIQEILDKE
jgi:hypothetical protein